MRRIGQVLSGCLLVLLAAAPAASPGCSCTSPPAGNNGGAGQPVPIPNELHLLQSRVRRDAPISYPIGTQPPTVKPMAYKDEKSGLVFYFERDGQHVSAIDPNGTVLWHTNPTERAYGRVFERDGEVFGRPVINSVGPPLAWMLQAARNASQTGQYIAIGFNKEGGLLDVKTGEHFCCGSD